MSNHPETAQKKRSLSTLVASWVDGRGPRLPELDESTRDRVDWGRIWPYVVIASGLPVRVRRRRQSDCRHRRGDSVCRPHVRADRVLPPLFLRIARSRRRVAVSRVCAPRRLRRAARSNLVGCAPSSSFTPARTRNTTCIRLSTAGFCGVTWVGSCRVDTSRRTCRECATSSAFGAQSQSTRFDILVPIAQGAALFAFGTVLEQRFPGLGTNGTLQRAGLVRRRWRGRGARVARRAARSHDDPTRHQGSALDGSIGAAILSRSSSSRCASRTRATPRSISPRRRRAAPLAARMQLALSFGVGSGEERVLAVTDEESKTYADRRDAATGDVERERDELALILKSEGTQTERDALAQFSELLAEVRRIDDSLLGLAGPEHEPQGGPALAFGPAAEAVRGMDVALDHLVAARAESPDAKQVNAPRRPCADRGAADRDAACRLTSRRRATGGWTSWKPRMKVRPTSRSTGTSPPSRRSPPSAATPILAAAVSGYTKFT